MRAMPISPSRGNEYFWDKQEAESFASELLKRYPEMPYMTSATIIEVHGHHTKMPYQVKYYVGSAD